MIIRRLQILVVSLVMAGSATAQWLQYPTAGVPRDARGKPNLSAPAPRTSDGKPDLSGVWQMDASCGGEVPCRTDVQLGDYPVAPEFLNIGARLRNGLPYQPWAAAAVKERSGRFGSDDPISNCRPAGALRVLTVPPPRKLVQTPDLIVILAEREVTYRQIFTDGRPVLKDPEPSFNGYSTGRWTKDGLVVQTNGFRDGMWLDRRGSPLTDAARVTETFRRVNYGRLEIDVTVDDPKAYTAPWTVTLVEKIMLDTDLLEYHCNDNEKDRAHLVGK